MLWFQGVWCVGPNSYMLVQFVVIAGAERVLHLRLELPGELPPLVIEMLDRQENVCIL